ncbi:hypothetical protein U3516DRAFT_760581 [Neocallimastix sp. 'constans']
MFYNLNEFKSLFDCAFRNHAFRNGYHLEELIKKNNTTTTKYNNRNNNNNDNDNDKNKFHTSKINKKNPYSSIYSSDIK